MILICYWFTILFYININKILKNNKVWGVETDVKIDRLLEIITILLNRDSVSAKTLADRFQVSVRTIQRDMVSISLAGIPIYSTEGNSGGYAIISDYKVKNQIMKPEEQHLLIKALESLATSYSSNSLAELIKKYNSIADRQKGQKIFWDFGVTKENQTVQCSNTLLEKAISDNRMIQFRYRNAKGEESSKTVQPLAIHYKWYAWYLFSWVHETKEYRTFKVARIQDLKLTEIISDLQFNDVEAKMKESEKEYYRTCCPIEIQFYWESVELMEEYFPDCMMEQVEGNLFRLILNVPQNERLWKALLLSFGNKIKIISPAGYQQELIDTARKFLSNYDI